MVPMSPGDDFAPKIFILGRTNTSRSLMLEALLEEHQSRFGVESAGIDPAETPDEKTLRVLEELDLEQVNLKELNSEPISTALDDHIKLVVYVSQSLKEDAPIIATAGDKVTLDVPEVDESRADDPLEAHRRVLNYIESEALEVILEEELELTS
ncbi:MAG: hypothetical protein ABEK50_14500 [bacterium]